MKRTVPKGILALPAFACLLALPLHVRAAPAVVDALQNTSFEEEINYGRVMDLAGDVDDTYVDVDGGRILLTNDPKWITVPRFSKQKFAWTSTQPHDTSWVEDVPAHTVQVNFDKYSGNAYAEICIHSESAIYQDVNTIPGSIYKWELKHCAYRKEYADTMQVLIGPSTGTLLPQPAVRTGNAGDASYPLGPVGLNITSPTKGNEHDYEDSWMSYTGTYLVPEGQTVTRFSFKAVDGYGALWGNNLDDIYFQPCFALRYDSNGGEPMAFDPKAGNYQGYFWENQTVAPARVTDERPVREGHTFLGWSEQPMEPFTNHEDYWAHASEILTADGAFRMPKNHKTVYAVWARNPTATWTDGDLTWEQQSTGFGGWVPGPDTSPAKPGYSHGWEGAAPNPMWEDVTIPSVWTPNPYTLSYERNLAGATVSRDSQTVLYDEPWGELATASRDGYTFLGWYTRPDGGERFTDQEVCTGEDIIRDNGKTVYGHWRPNGYQIVFDPNEDHAPGTVTGKMDSIRLSYDEKRALPANRYQKVTLVPAEDEGEPDMAKPSVFKGWSADPDALTGAYLDGAQVMNLSKKDGDTITLYAIWDDAPRFQVESYPDRYFTLEEAKSGAITERELLETVVVYDRESRLLPKKTSEEAAGDDTGVTVVNYDPREFTSLTDDGSVSIRYKVRDGAGNMAYLNIVVWVSRNGRFPGQEASYYRSISSTYAGKGALEGGLAAGSRWADDVRYGAALARAFAGDAKSYDLRLSKSQLGRIREHVESQGFGNSRSEDGLFGLWDAVGRPAP